MYAGDVVNMPSTATHTPRHKLGKKPVRPVRISDRSKLECAFESPDVMTASIAAQWTVLADQAAEPNCFAERWFLQPALALLGEPGEIKMAVVTSKSGLLVGLMPLTVKASYGRIPIENVQNWKHHNAFLGAPLIRAGLETQFWEAVLVALDRSDWAKGLLHIDGLPENGRTLRGLRRAATRLDRPCETVYRTRRALLKSDATASEYWETSVRKKKRKEIARLSNRLEDLGTVEYRTLAAGEDAGPWIDSFLALEKAGWKGKAGTALGCNTALTGFFTTAMLGAHAAGKLDFHRIDLDGKPIAMLINFLSAPGGFSFKIAFDEEYARYSPGVLIEKYNLRILERPEIGWLDSCAAEDHSMIDSIWTERRDILRVSVSLGGRKAGFLYRACRMTEDGASLARKTARHMRKSSDG